MSKELEQEEITGGSPEWRRFMKIWKKSEFGVKTRVFETYRQQDINYIQRHPNFQDKEKMNDIIKLVKEVSKDVQEDVETMVKEIEEI